MQISPQLPRHGNGHNGRSSPYRQTLDSFGRLELSSTADFSMESDHFRIHRLCRHYNMPQPRFNEGRKHAVAAKLKQVSSTSDMLRRLDTYGGMSALS